MSPMDIEQYKRDMMKLYGRRTPSDIPEKVPEKVAESVPETAPEPEIPQAEIVPQEDTEQETATDDDTAEDSAENSGEANVAERFPEPDLSGLESGEYPVPSYVSEESLGDSTGYILVNVRTGNQAYPVENASVMITAIVDGNRFIIASGLTDISGATIRLQTPAPDIIYSQAPDSKTRPYSLFDISVRADGYFNARSVDVPVFSGITSIQNFNMIPVPLLMKSSDETLTYFNQEPNL
ncbi:MAG: carboxypeptidase regulatory-like domain-containing protein [Ruminococcus flavefaciens]|nr:carboxypeptidase regulatory-like domain-containing protein [Ruminococcus flavefaciens]MCM1229819.1 carboxypeptidase regulatory-like domain-containing protein [Ruminococcus flavefaciens]